MTDVGRAFKDLRADEFIQGVSDAADVVFNKRDATTADVGMVQALAQLGTARALLDVNATLFELLLEIRRR